MRKHRFYIDLPNPQIGDTISISNDEANHIKNALRLKPGDTIFLFNGGNEFKAELTSVRNNSAEAKLIEITRTDEGSNDLKVKLTVFLSLIKANNFELALQKITELGVNTIVPLITDFSVVKVKDAGKKVDRWQKIVIAACKQSERIDIPTITEPIGFKDLKSNSEKFNLDKLLFFTTNTSNTDVVLLSEINLSNAENIGIIIGPEGGFSPAEEHFARELNLIPVSIGENILKAETAAIVASALVMYESSRG